VRANVRMDWTPDAKVKIGEAQAKVDAAKTDKQQEALAYQNAASEIKNLHTQAARYSLIPELNSDGTWTLHSPHPKINKSFGGSAKKADVSESAAAPASPQLPFWARPPSPGELTAGGASNLNVPSYQFAAPTETATTLPASAPASTPTPEPANYGFTPQSASWLNNPAELVKGYGRAANYFLAGRQGPQAPPLTVGGMARAAIGNPQQWLPPVPPGRVRVIGPDGKTGTVPQDQLPQALAAGFQPA